LRKWEEKASLPTRTATFYIAAGQVFVYNHPRQLIDTIEVPERPTQLLFGGNDGKNFISLLHEVRSTRYKLGTKVGSISKKALSLFVADAAHVTFHVFKKIELGHFVA